MEFLRAEFKRLAFVVCAVLIVYALTMSASLTWAHDGADGGDLASAIVRGALPHPPGFPAYLIFGDVFARVPVGEIAYRLNWLSALSAVGASVLIFFVVLRANQNYFVASVASLTFAFAPLVWSQAIIVEVYTLAGLFAALMLLLAQFDAPTWVRAATLGLACGAHPTLVLLAPLIVPRPDRFEKPVRSLGAFLLAWLAMYDGALFVFNRAPSAWGDVTTIQGWWSFVSGEMYRAYLFALPIAELPARAFALIVLMLKQFTPPGTLLAAYGFAQRWRERRAQALLELLAFAAIALFALLYDTSDSRAYLLIAMPLAAFWLGQGIGRVPNRWRLVLVVLPVLQLGIFWSEMNLRDDRVAIDWAEQILRAAPANAIVLTERDAHTLALWYARDVRGLRPDVIVLDRDLWAQTSYRQMMTREFNLPDVATADESAQQSARAMEWVR